MKSTIQKIIFKIFTFGRMNWKKRKKCVFGQYIHKSMRVYVIKFLLKKIVLNCFSLCVPRTASAGVFRCCCSPLVCSTLFLSSCVYVYFWHRDIKPWIHTQRLFPAFSRFYSLILHVRFGGGHQSEHEYNMSIIRKSICNTNDKRATKCSPPAGLIAERFFVCL